MPDKPSLRSLTKITQEAMSEVNKVILDRLQSDVALIPQLAGHLISAGGKRLRPMLCIAASMAINKNNVAPPKSALYLAASVEFIHNATLLHDDVIDSSDQRRGNKTANAIWGNEASVLVGDFLFARAFELMVETNDIWILEKLSAASAQITEGEVKQMSMLGQPDSPISDYFSVIKGKTGVLFAAAAQTGSKVGNGGDELNSCFHQYGLALGNAFQIMDDALDYGASTKQIGKDLGDDFAEMKITLPIILAWQDSNNTERGFWLRTLKQGNQTESDFDKACSIINKYNCIERSLDYAEAEANKAIEAISNIPNIELREALVETARFAALRNN
ncbi:polyprenyl synthetase family protein [Alphaproteobacteria bacterium]|nr:polyprenyl synthetase family protein [Alphaproteobacteria bacterium]